MSESTDRDAVKSLLELGKERNIFAKYGLTRNPFPAHELPEVSDISSYVKNVCIAVREKELKEIKEKFLEIAFGQADQPGQSTNLWVHGELGVGKSAVIIFVYNLLKEYKSDIVVPLYIVSPGNGIDDIYEGTVRILGRSFYEKLSRKLLLKILKEHNELIHAENPGEVLNRLDEDTIITDLLNKDALDQDELIQTAKSSLAEGRLYIDEKMLRLILEMSMAPEEAWETIKNYTKRNRLDALVTMFYLFSQAGYKMTFLFIDQLEYSWRIWGKQKRTRFVMDVRELVQRSIPYLAVQVTSNADLTEDIEVNHPTFLRPLPMDPAKVVVVKKLKKEQIRTLVEFYLDLARISKKSPELFPFTEPAIDYIYDEKEGVTGHILIACNGLLHHAARRNFEIIDEKVTKEYFEKTEAKEKEEEEAEVSETEGAEEDILR